MSAETVQVERDGPIAVVTLNRPDKLNALAPGMIDALVAALTSIGADPQCRAVVLTGAGTSFSAGADRGAGVAAASTSGVVEEAHRRMRTFVAVITALRSMPQPVIAAVRGHAVGAGFAFAAACDIRIAAPDARFNAIFTRIGLSAGDLGLSWFLPRQIGPSAAAELFFTGGVLDATRALQLGFVSRVADDPLDEARALAAEIAAQPAFGVRMSKELLSASLDAGGLRTHLEMELRSQILCSLTDDHAAVTRAWANAHAAGNQA